MDEDQIADVLKSERLGHEEPWMRGVYGHVSQSMRGELKAALEARWQESLHQRAQITPRSAIPLAGQVGHRVFVPPWADAHSRLAPKIGHRRRRNANRRSPDTV
jgi:hypothetical protein